MAPIAQNQDIARRLQEVAQLLEDQGANRFRLRGYREAAETIKPLAAPAAEIAQQQGIDGLHALPGIGVSLARSIHTLVITGRLPMLDRLRGRMDPVSLLTSIPGIGPALAHRLHNDLHIESLEQLEMAAHDGRLADIEGVGPKKLQGIVDSLTARLGRVRKPPQGAETHRSREPVMLGQLTSSPAEIRNAGLAQILAGLDTFLASPAGPYIRPTVPEPHRFIRGEGLSPQSPLSECSSISVHLFQLVRNEQP